jgi:hypothetical protein
MKGGDVEVVESSRVEVRRVFRIVTWLGRVDRLSASKSYGRLIPLNLCTLLWKRTSS